jgi:peptidoglycan-associated lipoprotein
VIGLSGVIAFSGCHKKIAPPPPPPPPSPKAAAPTATIQVNPKAILQGQTATLTWSTTNATDTTIDGDGIGTVATSGSRSVTPTRSSDYTLTAKGPGGTVEASTRITVNQPPPTPAPLPPALTEEELFSKNMQDVYFDYDKSNLRTDATAAVSQDADFLKQHTGMKIVIEGHCDDRGSEEYNLSLGESRAEAMKNALALDGIDASRIRVVSLGKEKPFCTDETEQCWQQNRRDHVKLDR